ncbi:MULTISPECIES: hypothetical protein [Thermococcus]|uniref:Uncharacterized protein n=1 Tax=Thermococcus sibiricus (strain DSM 12597 / MM 739) TaxID=604354 RepID=C6A0Q8_THESM|nr:MULTISPECIES: hypothetical protein [Thermococcus]ACS89203.1 hypothetical protein TSIB_0135 [Thermococcus sibiricus MM 739]KUK28996.1 MAG: Uncharacterized protein XD61_0450 [Thermococcus sp. 40_45]MBC7095695.1 hypothetical protein [Thermococcus sp.]HII67281.1 hypothetical protein [Thermococcaceae archaeon]
MKFSGLWLMLILIGGLIPIGATFAQNQSTSEYLGEQNNEEIAGEIINQLTKLSTLVNIRVKPVESRLPENLLKDYDKAKELKEKALTEYQNGNYLQAIQYSLGAMRYYKGILKALEEDEKTPGVLRTQIQEESTRVFAYFTYVEKLIEVAKSKGIDVENLTKAYVEAKTAYVEVLEYIENGNLEEAKISLEKAKQKKMELDIETRDLTTKLTSKNAEMIVKSFLIKTNQSITTAEKAIEYAKSRGRETGEAEKAMEKIKGIYLQVTYLANEGKWIDALRVIGENADYMKNFFMTIEKVKSEKMNTEVFLMMTRERIRKDATALATLRKKGIQTTRAEIQLRGAINEFSIAISLIKKNDVNSAILHLQRANRLLTEVEEFINANS